MMTEGPTVPHLSGGHPALALSNAGDFTTYESFLGWACSAALISADLVADLSAEADRRRGQASHVLHEVRMLQSAIREAIADPGRAAGYERITRLAHQAYGDAVLLPGSPARWELGRALETPLYAAGLAAVDLLTEVDLHTIRTCPVAGCGTLYLPGSACERHGAERGTVGDRAPRSTNVADFERAIA